jgi:cobalt/nickel transport system permease protein
MAKIESAFADLHALDTLAARQSPVHRLAPRIKVLTTLAYLICVVSYDRYEVAPLLPFGLLLVLIIGLAGLPAAVIGRKLLLAAPFAVLVGLFNPVFDQQPMLQLGPIVVSGGWVSLTSLLLRFCLTISAALVLIATTGFNAVCQALQQLGMPTLFTVQLLLLYRYLFVLVEEGQRIHRARALRSFEGRGLGMRTFGHLTGSLLLRTLDRGQRIHRAMLCRGFNGTMPSCQPTRLSARDGLWLAITILGLVVLRCTNGPQLLGRLVTGGLP